MTCPATLANLGRLHCTRTDPHQPHAGCTYEATPADPKHDDQEQDR